ncbi:hypothetical protein TNCV_2080421 [Trichonephila clavipes]|nr:hypothetical protein TNCV_2080421 [Trichonephila clavipes]
MQGARASFKHGHPARAPSSNFPVSSKRLTNFKRPAVTSDARGRRVIMVANSWSALLSTGAARQAYKNKQNRGWKEKLSRSDRQVLKQIETSKKRTAAKVTAELALLASSFPSVNNYRWKAPSRFVISIFKSTLLYLSLVNNKRQIISEIMMAMKQIR